MSRLSSLSPAALKAMFSADADDTLLCLMTITGTGIAAPMRISDGYTHRFEWLSSTSMTVTDIESGASSSYTYLSTDAVIQEAINSDKDNVLYGVKSGAVHFIFLPLKITLPTEEHAAVPRCSLTLHDVTRLVTPMIRGISGAPSVSLDLVLGKTPSTIEASFPGFLMGGIHYSADSVTAELTVESYSTEPFPCHTFTPSLAPGLF